MSVLPLPSFQYLGAKPNHESEGKEPRKHLAEVRGTGEGRGVDVWGIRGSVRMMPVENSGREHQAVPKAWHQ